MQPLPRWWDDADRSVRRTDETAPTDVVDAALGASPLPASGDDGRLARVRDAVRRFLGQLRDDQAGGYRFHAEGHVTLLSTCFAIRTLHLLDALEDVPASFVERIAELEEPGGTFADPTWRAEETTGSHSASYLQWQTTFFALSTLDMLGEKPRSNLSFVDSLIDPVQLRRWVLQLDWHNFWYGSNELMFLLYFLAFRAERQRDEAAALAAQECLDLLDTLQHPETGYFVRDATAMVENQMYGAAHVCLFYDYWQRPLQHPARMIDTTLSLANGRGLYGSRSGGACEDYDAVEVLLRAAAQTPHRHEEVSRSLARTATTIASAQARSGGFAYRLRGGIAAPLAAATARWVRQRTYSYSGWQRMTAPVFLPDTWGTYFRALAIAAVHHRAGRDRYRFYDLPAWGYGGVAIGGRAETLQAKSA
jgi:hypothetical protein